MARALLVVAALLGSACGSGGNQAAQPAEPAVVENRAPEPAASPPPSEVEQALAEIQRFADKICACTDPECVRRVSDEMTEWSQEHARTSKGPLDMNEAQQKRATEIGMRMGECITAAMSTEAQP